MIEVGEYVRTSSGRIYKLGYYSEEERRWIVVTDEDWYPVYTSEIVKHSKNIIDLIEVGDYVNCNKVLSIVTDLENKDVIGLKFLHNDNILWFSSKDIKSIVTKEQMKNIEYRLE